MGRMVSRVISIGTCQQVLARGTRTSGYSTSPSRGGPMSESSGGPGSSEEPVSRAATEPGTESGPKRKPLYHHLYFWVLLAIVAGAVVGVVAPSFAVELKPLADGFVKLIRMLIAPIIFTTVVVGIASLGDLTKAGRLGIKALTYFITMTLIALAIGLVVINVLQPGAGST